MDFLWTKEQDELYEHIVRLTSEKLSTKGVDPDQPWTRAQWLLCGDFHLLGLSVPARYGGCGYDALTTARALEAFGYSCEDMGLVFSVAAHLFACAMPIVEHGDEEAREKFLPTLCSGTFVGANAITEQNAGSDIFALKAHATRDGNSYILTGQKSYVSNGPTADLFLVYAVTNPAHGYLGITAFVVEKDTPGLVLGNPLRKMGLTSTPACQVSFDHCRVPVGNRLGQEGQGSQVFKHSMMWERSCLFAAYLGQLQRQLEQTIVYVKQRCQFGKPLGKHQIVAHRVADMKLRLEAARLLLYRACWLFDQKQDAQLAISLSKLAVSEAAIQGGLDALHLHGSTGLGREYGLERMLRDAIPSTIFSGTSEVLRDIVANELGL